MWNRFILSSVYARGSKDEATSWFETRLSALLRTETHGAELQLIEDEPAAWKIVIP